jgi:hypothetical protein
MKNQVLLVVLLVCAPAAASGQRRDAAAPGVCHADLRPSGRASVGDLGDTRAGALAALLSLKAQDAPPQPIQDSPQKQPSEQRAAQPPDPGRATDAPGQKPQGSTAGRWMTQLEKRRVVERIRLIFGNPYIHPLVGGLGDGSGFGLGVGLATGKEDANFRLVSSVHATFRQYLLATAGFTADPTGGRRERYELDVIARYRLRPQDDFFGQGPRSVEGDRTNYDLQERGVTAVFAVRPAKVLRLGVGLDYSSSRVFGGTDRRFRQTQQLFPNLPGLARGAELIGPQAFVEVDARDQPGKPRRGAFLSFVAASYDGLGAADDFGFHNFVLDARGYLPLGTPRRVLALRLLGVFNDPKGGSQIPFFRLAHIGDTRTLRGYSSLRFYGRNALAANVEYRRELTRRVGALLFTDFGQVFDRRSEISAANLRATFGGGIEFSSKRFTVFRFLVARSGERTRLILGFGPTF